MKKDFCFLFVFKSHQPDVLNFFYFAESTSIKHLEYLQYKIEDSISITKLMFLTFVDHTAV